MKTQWRFGSERDLFENKKRKGATQQWESINRFPTQITRHQHHNYPPHCPNHYHFHLLQHWLLGGYFRSPYVCTYPCMTSRSERKDNFHSCSYDYIHRTTGSAQLLELENHSSKLCTDHHLCMTIHDLLAQERFGTGVDIASISMTGSLLWVYDFAMCHGKEVADGIQFSHVWQK